MDTVTPFLWFNDKAEEAVNFYVSVFPNSRVLSTTHMSEDVPGPKGKVLVINFELDGRPFTALNGGDAGFHFNESVSLYVHCRDQREVDRLWARLTEGGEPGPCGWLKDRYGLSWQIVPDALSRMLNDPDASKAQRVTQAMLKMGKLDVAELQRAYDTA